MGQTNKAEDNKRQLVFTCHTNYLQCGQDQDDSELDLNDHINIVMIKGMDQVTNDYDQHS